MCPPLSVTDHTSPNLESEVLIEALPEHSLLYQASLDSFDDFEQIVDWDLDPIEVTFSINSSPIQAGDPLAVESEPNKSSGK